MLEDVVTNPVYKEKPRKGSQETLSTEVMLKDSQGERKEGIADKEHANIYSLLFRNRGRNLNRDSQEN
jgi:hypothetical protein